MRLALLLLALAVHKPSFADTTYPIQPEPSYETQRGWLSEPYEIARLLKENRMTEVQYRTNFALNAMIRRGVAELRKKGHHEEADKIEGQWTNRYSKFLLRMGIGDFEPLSDWLSAIYITLELLLGENLMRALHLDDIHILNHTIPVVFAPCRGPWVKEDYAEHFGALSGVVGYWSIFIGCTLSTSGLGLFFCSPAGMLGELVLSRLLGPGVGRSVYSAICE